MIFWLIFVGFLSAFALGPASFNIIRSLITQKTWPWASIAGFLLGDLIYIGLAIALLRSPLLQEPWLKTLLTVLTVFCLVIYSGKILLPKRASSDLVKEPLSNPSFKQSLLLTLTNFHLVFIYAGLFANLSITANSLLYWGVIAYFTAFILTFLGMLYGLQIFQKSLRNLLRRFEVIAACGFLTFSLYISLEIL